MEIICILLFDYEMRKYSVSYTCTGKPLDYIIESKTLLTMIRLKQTKAKPRSKYIKSVNRLKKTIVISKLHFN